MAKENAAASSSSSRFRSPRSVAAAAAAAANEGNRDESFSRKRPAPPPLQVDEEVKSGPASKRSATRASPNVRRPEGEGEQGRAVQRGRGRKLREGFSKFDTAAGLGEATKVDEKCSPLTQRREGLPGQGGGGKLI
eukprot:746073-Hanusia_phi.AAC.4